MTYKQPDGHESRRYRYRASASVSRPVVRRKEPGRYDVREQQAPVRSARGNQPGEARRMVTMPHEAVQPLTWAERHERFRTQRAGKSGQGRLVQRTLAQTGRPAPIGQMRARKPLPRQRNASRVPVRSGKLRHGKNFWRRLFGLLIVLAVVGGGVGFALFSPTFRVQQVNIEGTQNQGLIATIRRMGIQGQDIFLLNQSALVGRLDALPLVASASLGMQLPNSITVVVQERTPVLLWQTGANTFAVAQDGMVIAPLGELSGASHLALVVDKRHAALQMRPGAHLSAADIAFVEQVFAQLPGIQGVTPFTLQYVDSIVIGGQAEPANQAGGGSYVVVSANGWQAFLGDSQNSNSLANRLQELQQILGIARQQHLQLATIDLRFGLRPVYTLKS